MTADRTSAVVTAATTPAPRPREPASRRDHDASPAALGEAVLRLQDAALRFGDRTLWAGLDLEIRAGEFIAVLGANGTGKSSLLKVILGQQPLTAGRAEFRPGAADRWEPIRRGNRRIGYVPQQRLADEGVPLRGQDLVALGVDGHRWGIPLPNRARRERVRALVDAVGAGRDRRRPLATLSGGEQQRLRIGQALAGDPRLLLCDEPLLSLDLANQRIVSELVDSGRRDQHLGVLFVTHDINPVLGYVDRVLYLAGGRFRIGPPDEVLRSDVLSGLYGSPVEVVTAHGRIIVVGAGDDAAGQHSQAGAHHDQDHEAEDA